MDGGGGGHEREERGERGGNDRKEDNLIRSHITCVVQYVPVLGLKPTFFRNGVSLVLHSSYLKKHTCTCMCGCIYSCIRHWLN